ncbi:MAG: glycosyltransferase family 2 protein [Lachnospiraceae bacterium]|nr:glycosyltransferase family 2 protein [Lachnospiraceae bacterium]
MQKAVTVVIPNWNGIRYLENCLKSVLASDTEAEIIVVDNGSTDGSEELVRKEFPSVKLVCFPENKGFSAAVNAGIALSEAPYIFLLNNDTLVRPDTIRRLLKEMRKNPRTFSCQALMLRMSDEKRVDSAGDFYCAAGWAFALGKDRDAADFERYTSRRRIFSSCAGAALYSRKILDEIGWFDEGHFAYLEDVDIGYRARIRGYENYVIKDAVVLHEGSASSGSRYNDFKVRLSARNNIYLIYKNMPAFQILLNLPFLIPGFLIKTFFFIRKGLGGSYLKGLREGFALCFTKGGRRHKIRFRKERLKTYAAIQLMLYLNLIRFLAA